MVIKDVIGLLTADSQLKQMLGGNHIYLSPTSYVGEAIVYSWQPITSDKIKRLDKLEVSIITENVSKGFEIENRVKELLLTLGDKPLISGVQQCYLNGGGNIYDYDRKKNHRILYFYILSKE